MGVLKGSISYSKFYVSGELPDGFKEKFLEHVQLRVFKQLTVDSEEDQHIGWVPLERPLDPDPCFQYDDLYYGSYVSLAMRIDAWRFPGQVLKAAFAEAEKKYLAKKGREKLTKREKDELKIMVSRKLRHSFSPTIKVIDMVWNLEQGTLRFWNQSAKTHEYFFELFEKTFPVKLVPASPYVTAMHAGLPEQRTQTIEKLEPAIFAMASPLAERGREDGYVAAHREQAVSGA